MENIIVLIILLIVLIYLIFADRGSYTTYRNDWIAISPWLNGCGLLAVAWILYLLPSDVTFFLTFVILFGMITERWRR